MEAAKTLALFLCVPAPHAEQLVALPLQQEQSAAVQQHLRARTHERPQESRRELLVTALKLSAVVCAYPWTLPEHVVRAVGTCLVVLRAAKDETTRSLIRRALSDFWAAHRTWWKVEYAKHFSEEDSDELRCMCGNNHYFA